MELDGQNLRLDSPQAAMSAGLAYVPEDRAREASFPSLAVTHNLSMAVIGSYWRAGWFRHSAERSDARQLLAAFRIKAPSEQAPFASLSGGNQQKVILARHLRRTPRALLLDEPTHGVDFGGRAEIHELVRQAVGSGATAIVVSSEFEEIEAMCDRVLIMRHGAIAGELAARISRPPVWRKWSWRKPAGESASKY